MVFSLLISGWYLEIFICLFLSDVWDFTVVYACFMHLSWSYYSIIYPNNHLTPPQIHAYHLGFSWKDIRVKQY